jgi:HSP20 family protein
MSLLDADVLSRLAAMGIDVTALVRSCSPATACACSSPGQWQPPADVYEVDGKVVLKLELAGVDIQAVTLTAAENLVVVSGMRRDESPGPRSAVGHMEIEYGPFEKRIWLPWPVRLEGIRASYDRGFLLIALEKAPRPLTRRISIRVRV